MIYKDVIDVCVVPFMVAQIRRQTRRRISVMTQKGHLPMVDANTHRLPYEIYQSPPLCTPIEAGMMLRFYHPDADADATVLVTRVSAVGSPTIADARSEGLETVKSLKASWKKYGLMDGYVVWSIDFELVERIIQNNKAQFSRAEGLSHA